MDGITTETLGRRSYWVDEIRNLSGSFGDNATKLESKLSAEIKKNGMVSLVDHLRLCGNIPESYQHDSSEEKLYSKYTDIILCEAFKSLGIKSIVLRERADAADVEAFATNYSFVADAKAFRLSRTAKNQKDFKVQAIDGWKRGKPYAIVVCPIYQLPIRSSQIYQQASVRNVCILTYSHLAILVAYALRSTGHDAETLLHAILKSIQTLNPSKEAADYWYCVNRTMLSFSKSKDLEDLWQIEKQAAVGSIKIAKEEALMYLAQEREKIMRMSYEQALSELMKVHKIQSRMNVISSIKDNDILGMR